MMYRVVYGETRPMWEQSFRTMRAAVAFAKNHLSFGDVIFEIGAVDHNDATPHSIGAAIETEDARRERAWMERR